MRYQFYLLYEAPVQRKNYSQRENTLQTHNEGSIAQVHRIDIQKEHNFTTVTL